MIQQALHEHWIYDQSSLVCLHLTPKSSSSRHYKTLPHIDPGPGFVLCPSFQASQLLRAAKLLKREGSSEQSLALRRRLLDFWGCVGTSTSLTAYHGHCTTVTDGGSKLISLLNLLLSSRSFVAEHKVS